MTCLHHEHYYELDELKDDWQVCTGKLKRWLITGALKPHIWLPVMSVFEITEVASETFTDCVQKLRHYEGFVPLTHYHCQRLYRVGKLTIRSFQSKRQTIRFRLPQTSEDIVIDAHDLLILGPNKAQFEEEYLAQSAGELSTTILADPDFRAIELNGEKHHFGALQSAILKRLYEAAVSEHPWQNGKQLLHKAGSESFTISNVFNRKPVWKKLIESDGRGNYRLSADFKLNEVLRPIR